MADSAMMREAMPTVPRYGRVHPSGVSRAGVAVAFVALIAHSLFLSVGPNTYGFARSGSRFAARRFRYTAASLIGQWPIPLHSFVEAVRVFRMLQIPQRPAAG